MTEAATYQLVITHTYSAPPEKVFDAFLDVKIARRFLFATAKGEMITAEIDPRVGGKFTFTEKRPEMGDVRHVGEFLEIDRPARLGFRLGVPLISSGTTKVTIEIQPEGDSCVLTLKHDGVTVEHKQGAEEGWSRILAGLLPACEGIYAAGWHA